MNEHNNAQFYDEQTDTIWFYDEYGNLKGLDQCPNCQNGEQVEGKYLSLVDRQRIEMGIKAAIHQT